MSTRIIAHSPQALHTVLEDAFNRGDLDAYLDAHDEHATVVVPPEGRVVQGKAEIRAASAAIFAAAPHLTSVVQRKLVAGDVALTQAKWELTATSPDGERIELTGRAALVSRQRPDGTWTIVLDDPMSG